jgi:hypothetical protein
MPAFTSTDAITIALTALRDGFSSSRISPITAHSQNIGPYGVADITSPAPSPLTSRRHTTSSGFRVSSPR